MLKYCCLSTMAMTRVFLPRLGNPQMAIWDHRNRLFRPKTGMKPLRISRIFVLFILAVSLWTPRSRAAATVYPVPSEIRSDRFTLRIDGQPADVAHAATTYYFANFELHGNAEVSLTAPSDDYWLKGVEIQPWRWDIRPIRSGRTITFTVSQPMKLSISRPGDHGAGAEMIFLFANEPETTPPHPDDPRVRYFGPGVYHQNIDAKSGDSIYLAPGAVVFGAINVWGVENVRISGRGTVVYDGPQNPKDDQGWIHRPNWHVIVMDHARHIQISGITCVVRSRTWMIQLLGSHDITFENVKVIGGCPGNANQDGIDWLGGGDTVVRDCFFRASDDIFALYGNWLGYTQEDLTTPGEDVSNILVENSVLSTSISNVVRVSWPQKIFNSHNFAMRNSDVIHMGMGGCKIPFGLLEIWDDPGGRGLHSGFSFDDIRLEDWYSLAQLRQQQPAIRDVRLNKIWAIENPALVPSVVSGDVSDISLDGLTPRPGKLRASFTYSPGELVPGKPILFDASSSESPNGEVTKFEWQFGDGVNASGKTVQHAFPDTNGTLLDGSGRFRVLLTVTDSQGNSESMYRPVVLAPGFHSATSVSNLQAMSNSTRPAVDAGQGLENTNYSFDFTGYLDVPASGGYTFQLLSDDTGQLEIDSTLVAQSPAPKPQVCGSLGNMVQLATGTIGLEKGMHPIRIFMKHARGPGMLALKWQGPATLLSDLPASALFRH